MAKANKKTEVKKEQEVEKAEEVSKDFEEAKAKDQVSLEMSKEEAEEFAAFKLQKESEKKNKLEAEELKNDFRVMDLSFKHGVNGIEYGPGRTRVPREHIGLIQHNEQNQVKQEYRLNQQSQKNFYKLQRGAMPVKVDSLPQV